MLAIGGDDENERKRKSVADGVPIEETRKRRSRFADDDGAGKVGVAAIAAASERAAEISRNLSRSTPATTGLNEGLPQLLMTQETSAQLARAAEMQAQLSAQIASVSSLFSNAKQLAAVPVDRKPTYRPLLLDAQGREIDGYGQVVKTSVVKSIAANVAVERELKKKENPYLAHQRIPPKTSHGPPGVPSAPLSSLVPGAAIVQEDQGLSDQIDERIVGSNRNIRAKKSLKFVEAGERSSCMAYFRMIIY